MTPEQRTELIKAAFLDGIDEIVAGKRQMRKEAQSWLARAGSWLGQGLGIGATPAARAMGVGSLKRFALPAIGALGMGAATGFDPWMMAGGALGGHALGALGRGVGRMLPGAGQTYEQTFRAMQQDVARRFPNMLPAQQIAEAQRGMQAMMTGPGSDAVAQGMIRAGAPRVGLGTAVALPAAALGGMGLLGKGKEMIMGDGSGGGGGGILGGGGGGGLGFLPSLAVSGLGGYGGYQAGEAMNLPWWGKWGLGALGATMAPGLVGSVVGGPGGGAMPAGYGY